MIARDDWLEEEEVVDPGMYVVVTENGTGGSSSDDAPAFREFLARACDCGGRGGDGKYAVGFREEGQRALHWVFSTQKMATEFGEAARGPSILRCRKVEVEETLPDWVK